MDRRHFLSAAAGALSASAQEFPVPAEIRQLKPMTAGVVPIADAERQGRLDKARRLMREQKVGAIFLEAGSSLYYFTGVRWTPSERLFGLVIPAQGELGWLVAAQDEKRASEVLRAGQDVRVWSDDPFPRLAQLLKDRGVAAGTLGMDERARFFVFDGIRRAVPGLEFTNADGVTAGCRMQKSAAELALMQRASDVTIAAYKAGLATLREGMPQNELQSNIHAAYRALGYPGYVSVMYGQYTAFPHGSITPQKLKLGDFVMIDDGCTVEGYQSDITRTVIFGKPTDRQRKVWALERKAQDAALAAARPGAPCEAVDLAARKVIEAGGFGPGYKTPGLPHRTGHGIGLDGHEWTYLVKGSKTPLAKGMCFSDEPMIAIYGEFGVRLEDCFYMTDDGPRLFSKQSPAIDQPFA
ncbi:MAG: Xaa-Pro peptidase family protein [Bryobacteraceae bacterium]|nr:Xaa-Pro peptidase family protein [Bryobacteraceae bacterium]